MRCMIGSMGQGGQAFVRGINDSGELTVRWYENNQTIDGCTTSSRPSHKRWEVLTPYY